MSYSDIKITQIDINNNNVRSASDILIGNADDNKAVFDRLPELIAGKHNELVDALDEVADQTQSDTDEIENLSLKKVNIPMVGNAPDFGEAGQVLTTKGNGQTKWEDAGRPTDEQTQHAIDDWLGRHPEATTTVQDGSLTETKFIDTLKRAKASFYTSVSEMVADTILIAGMKAVTFGYYSNGDGGGGEYYIREIGAGDSVSDTADGTTSKDGLVRLQNGLCAELIISNGLLNLKSTGIKSDNENDQYEKFFNALHIPGVSTFYLPAGYYIISDTIFVPANAELIGDGKDTIIYYNAEYSAFGAGISNGGSNVKIKDLSVEHKPSEPMFEVQRGSSDNYLGGIGLSGYTFESWDTLHKSPSAFTQQAVSNLQLVNIYSDSLYPVQTEPSQYDISNVVYDNIVAPNGLVSIYPSTAGMVKNAMVTNIECFMFRVGVGRAMASNINIDGVNTKMCALLEYGITARNIVCDCSESFVNNWYGNALTIAADIIKLSNITLKGGNDKDGIYNGALTVYMSDSTVKGFTTAWSNMSTSSTPYVYLDNTYMEGTIRIPSGKISNSDGEYPLLTDQNMFKSYYSLIGNSRQIRVKMEYQAIVLVKRNDGSVSTTTAYSVAYLANSLSVMLLHEGQLATATFSYSDGYLTITNTTGSWAGISVFCY